MPHFIAGIYRDRALAQRVVTALLDSGVPSGEISFAVKDETEEDLPTRDELPTDEQPFVSLAVHSAWERLGWLGGARPAYRDQIPPDIDRAVLVAGPIGIALGGAQVGAIGSGLVGAMTNFGYDHILARDWMDRIEHGQAWVMVRCDAATREKVRETMQRFGPDTGAETHRNW